MNIHGQGALGVAGVRHVGYGLEVGRSVRTAGGAGAYCVATRTACYSSVASVYPMRQKYNLKWQQKGQLADSAKPSHVTMVKISFKKF